MLSTFYCQYNIGSCDLKVLVFILFQFKKRPNISGIQVVHKCFNPLTVTPLFEKLESALFKVKLL